MRKIKFRAWNPHMNEMLDVMSIYLRDGIVKRITAKSQGVTNILKNGWFDLKDGDENEVEMMQFTGLHDKNGVEIYEGDIIAFPYVTPDGKLYYGEENEDVRQVFYRYGSFVVDRLTDCDVLKDWIKTEEGTYIPNAGNVIVYKKFVGEVIGNIYENPELLYEKQK